MDSLTLKRYNSFKNKNNTKATYSFAPRPLIFKLQLDVLKFNDICVQLTVGALQKLTWRQTF